MTRSAALVRSRLAVILLLFAALLFLLAFAGPGAAVARAEDAPAATSSGSGPEPSLFKHIVTSAGYVFGPMLLLISIGLVALIVLLAMDLRLGNAIPPGFVEDFTDTVNKRQFKAAYEMARDDGSYLGRVLTTGMSRLQYGIEDAREAARNMVESVKAGKEQLITYLATIGTLGPLLGLVGTVWGMIKSFMVLSKPGAIIKPADLADGISHALVVTLLGIGLSVPAIFCHAFFRNRLIRIVMDTHTVADDLLTQMYHNSKKPAAPGQALPGQVMPVSAGPPERPAPTAADLIAADKAAVAGTKQKN
jgi:biopolymer transport protein ExbB